MNVPGLATVKALLKLSSNDENRNEGLNTTYAKC